jgi:deazaflavin-dependent oxidoreductase (nitroreductase family)
VVSPDDFNRKIIEEFRANEGRVGGPFDGVTVILLHHVGARSGIERVSPVACSVQGDGRFAVVAANGGSPRHPGWYHNLKAARRVTVELGTETFTVLAEEVDGSAHAELWLKLVAEFPHIAEFQTRAPRRIPLLILTRQD